MPLWPKVILAAAVAYLLLPADLVPDRALGIVGYADDLALLVLAVAWYLLRMPEALLQDARREGPEARRR